MLHMRVCWTFSFFKTFPGSDKKALSVCESDWASLLPRKEWGGKMAMFQTNKCFLLMQFTEFSVLLKHHVEIKTQQSDGLKIFTNSTNFSQSQCWIIKLTEKRQWHGFSLEVMERCADIRWTHTHSNPARKPERGKKQLALSWKS